MKIEFVIGMVGFAALSILIGLLVGHYNANNNALEACRTENNVNECLIIAIPKGKEGVYGNK